MPAELIIDMRNATGESPVWHRAEQALYWVDIPAGRLHRWQLADGQTQSWQAHEMLACIAVHPAGGWIAGMQSGIFHLHAQADGSLQGERLAEIEHALPQMRLNDGRCDRQGRFWAGSLQMNGASGVSAGALYRFDGQLQRHLEGLNVPNGLAFSPDGRTMYLSDSHPSIQAVWAFDYDTDSGTPHNRRLFIDMKQYPGRPDGAAIDVEGCYWICANDAGLIHRFTPDGHLDRSLSLPVSKPTMCAFGGRNLDTLFVTSIRPRGDVSAQPLAGGVFAIDPGVRGMAEPCYTNK